MVFLSACITFIKRELFTGGFFIRMRTSAWHLRRDLATRNILLSKHLEPKVTWHVTWVSDMWQVSDFGMSRETEDGGAGVTQSTMGPLKWMAPEGTVFDLFPQHFFYNLLRNISHKRQKILSGVGCFLFRVCLYNRNFVEFSSDIMQCGPLGNHYGRRPLERYLSHGGSLSSSHKTTATADSKNRKMDSRYDARWNFTQEFCTRYSRTNWVVVECWKSDPADRPNFAEITNTIAYETGLWTEMNTPAPSPPNSSSECSDELQRREEISTKIRGKYWSSQHTTPIGAKI